MSYLPSIPLEAFQDASKLDDHATKFSELLLLDIVNVGSILGVKISKHDPGISIIDITYYRY